MLLVASQIIGLAAVGLYLLSYQLKKRKQIVWVTCISNALYVLQYVLLGAFSGAILDFMSTVSSFLAAKEVAVVDAIIATAKKADRIFFFIIAYLQSPPETHIQPLQPAHE